MSDVELRFRSDERDAVRGAQAVERGLHGVERQAAQTGRRASASMNDLERSMLRMTGRAVIGLGAVTAAAGGFAAAMGLSFYKTKQSAEIAFTTMLGSGEKARKFLGELAAFAAKTPFEFPQLIQTSQQLLNVGFAAKDVIPLLTRVGDAVGAAGGSPEALTSTVRALGQIRSLGRLTAEEMNQLSEAGTFGWTQLAETLGTSVAKAREASEKGLISADVAIAAFVANADRRFKGMTEAQSHTMAGLASTIKDTFAATSSQALEPAFKRITDGMQEIADATAKPEFTAGVERFADFVETEAVPAVEGFVHAVIDHRDEIADAFREGADMAAGFASAAKDVHAAIKPVVQLLGGWDDVMKLILAASVIGRVARLTGAFTALAGAQAAAGAAAGAGTGIGGAAGAAALLRSNLLALIALPSIIIRLKILTDEDVPSWVKALVIGQISPLGAAIYGGKKLFGGDGEAAGGPAGGGAFRGGKFTGAIDALITGRGIRPAIGAEDTHGKGLLPAFKGAVPRSETGAVDYPAKVGTAILAPEDGQLTRTSDSGASTPGGPGGLSLYYIGESGTAYYMTHLMWVAKPGNYSQDALIGRIGPHVSGAHAHVEQSRHPAALTIARGLGTPAAAKAAGGATPIDFDPAAGGGDKKKKRQHVTLRDLAAEAAREFGIDPDLFYALIYTESKWNPKARSSAGAMGLTQLMPGTARGLGVKDPYDIEQNLTGGAKYLAQLYRRFGNWPDALAAYNAGPGNMRAGRGYARTVLARAAEGVPGGGAATDIPGAPDVADPAVLAKQRGAVNFILSHLERLLPDARAKIRREARALSKDLLDVVTDDDLEKLQGRFDRLTARWNVAAEVKRARDRMAAELKTIGRQLETIPDEFDAPMEKTLAQLRKQLARVGSPAQVDALEKAIDKLEQGAKDGFADWQDKTSRSFDRAWGKLRDRILKAFDEGVAGRIRIAAEFGEGQLGEARARRSRGRALSGIEGLGPLTGDEQTVRDAIDQMRRAQRDYAAAVLSGDRALIDQRADQLAHAEATFEEVEEQARARLAESDDEERKKRLDKLLEAGNELIEAERSLLDQRREENQRRLDELTTVQREQLEEYIDDQIELVRAGKKPWDEAWTDMKAKAKEFGLDLDTIGGTLGADFSTGLIAAVNGVRDAVLELARAFSGVRAEAEGAATAVRGIGPPGAGGRGGPPDLLDAGSVAGGGEMQSRYGTAAPPVQPNVTVTVAPVITLNGVMGATADEIARALAPHITDPVRGLLIQGVQRNGGNVTAFFGGR